MNTINKPRINIDKKTNRNRNFWWLSVDLFLSFGELSFGSLAPASFLTEEYLSQKKEKIINNKHRKKIKKVEGVKK